MERTVRVTGKGKLSIKPDLIRLQMTLEGIKDSYEETMKQSAEQTEQLRNCFAAMGFAPAGMKTLNFNINTEYESYQDEKNNWKQRFAGYKFVHSMKMEFAADNQLLGQVLYALAHCSVCPEVHIVYTVKDTEAAKNELLGKAVEDAFQKAEVLAQAAGVSLGQLQTIDYSWGELDLTARPMSKRFETVRSMPVNDAGSYTLNVEPDNIEVTDTVTVVWSLA